MARYVELFWVLAVFFGAAAVVSLLWLWLGRHLKRPRKYVRQATAAMIIGLVGGGFSMWGAIEAGQARSSDQAAAHRQFVEDVRPLVSELERLGFQPWSDSFFDKSVYQFNGERIETGSSGKVAVKNVNDRKIWINFEISENGARVGCLNGTLLVATTPFGARQLMATTGCDN